MVNLATKGERVMIDGWQTQTSFHPRDLVRDLQMSGIAGIVHTDIDRFEGEALSSLAVTLELAEAVSIPVLSSGTVHELDDIARLRELKSIHGAIVGHALIVGAFTLEQAREAGPQGAEDAELSVAEHGVHRGVRAYLAAYSLSQGARWWNRGLREAIAGSNPYMEVLIPQEDLQVDPAEVEPHELRALYEREIDAADVLIVVLDGIENAAWTGFECGFARARGKYIVGVRSLAPGLAPPSSRFSAMCDEIVDYDGSDDWNASLAQIAQDLGTHILSDQAFARTGG